MNGLTPLINKDRLIVLSLVLLKLLIHIIANANYGLHRDEYLYIDEGNHLAWGFMEVPPFTPFIGKIAVVLFGENPFAVRLFPTLIGVVVLILVLRMVKEFGGNNWAMLFAGIAFILSPSFLRSNMLFQPVCFNQFWWVLSAYFLIKLVNTKETKWWYWLGIAAGIGFMNKYSIGFFFAALLLGFLVTKHRKQLMTKHPWLALGIAFLIALPNLLWQYQMGWPVVHHMTELAATQLVNVTPAGFLMDQLQMQGVGFLIWIPGLIWLFRADKFAFLGWAYLFLMLILLLLSGKSYYSLGVYPILIAAGGVAVANLFTFEGASSKGKGLVWKNLLLTLLIIPNLVLMPLGIPVLSIENMKKYCQKAAEFGLEQRWEDGKIYDLPQDYADMFGWEEMVQKVAKFYHALPADQKRECQIFGGSYSHASTLNFYRKKYKLPVAVSFNGSYKLWAPDSAHFNTQILVDDVLNLTSPYFKNVQLVDSIENPYAREPGYIYYRSQPTMNLDSAWVERVKAERGE